MKVGNSSANIDQIVDAYFQQPNLKVVEKIIGYDILYCVDLGG